MTMSEANAEASLEHAVKEMRDAQVLTAQPSEKARAIAVALTHAQTALLWLRHALKA